jgi:peptidoglycan/LPS O-acetylase OafA/YrhL
VEQKKTRLFELDALRGLAALSVVLFHYTYRYHELYPEVRESNWFSFTYGNLGVHLFFIISGFVIYMTIVHCKSIKDFALKRATRLYPTYIVSVLTTFTVVWLFPLEDRGTSIVHALLNLSMLQGYMPSVTAVDGAYWSLTVEITFYIMIAVLFAYGSHRKILYFLYAWLILSALVKVSQYIHPNIISLLNEKRFLIADFSHLFVAGIAFYQLKVENKFKYHALIILCLLYDYAFNGVLQGSITLMFFLVFYALIYDKLTFLNGRVLTFLGTISYSLYLIHQNIGYVIITILRDHGLTNEVTLVIPISISIALASVITFLIEKPVQKYIRNKSNASLKRTTTLDKATGSFSA